MILFRNSLESFFQKGKAKLTSIDEASNFLLGSQRFSTLIYSEDEPEEYINNFFPLLMITIESVNVFYTNKLKAHCSLFNIN